MQQFDAILILLIMGAFSIAILVRQNKTGKGWGWAMLPVERNANPLPFLLAQAWWGGIARFCLCCAMWILVRPYL
jgi:hypothetical protein